MIALYILLGLLGLGLLLLLIALLRTLLSPAKQSLWKPAADPEREARYAETLSRMVRCETVSRKGEDQREKFLGFHRVLEELFPLVHQRLEKTADLCLKDLKTGDIKVLKKGVSGALIPSRDDNFSGDIAEGKVWGRGSADTKCSVMGFFQAVEELLEQGFEPEQDVYLSSSCTEEFGGDGCPKLVEELSRRGMKPFLVCDEGGAIVQEPIGGVKGCYAMIGVLEKGRGALRLTARSGGGHASYPPKNSPIARLGKFIARVEKRDPMRVEFEPEVTAMFRTLAPYGPFYLRLLFGNLWLFKPLLKKLLPKISPQAGALLKTTVAFTMQSGSDAPNVLPQQASLTLDLRYIPHQRLEESNRVIRELAARYDLETEVLMANDACEPVRIDSPAYALVEKVIGEVFPGLPTCPYDRLLATQFGTAAADLIVNKQYGRMVAIQDGHITSIPLDEAASKTKFLPVDHPIIQVARDIGICMGD